MPIAGLTSPFDRGATNLSSKGMDAASPRRQTFHVWDRANFFREFPMKRAAPLVWGMVFIGWWGLRAPGDEAGPEKGGLPRIPKKLKVPEGNRLLWSVEAEGLQIYVSKKGKGGKPEWVFQAPLA